MMPVNLSEIIPNASWEALDLIGVCILCVNTLSCQLVVYGILLFGYCFYERHLFIFHTCFIVSTVCL